MIKKYTIEDSFEGVRLDRWVKKNIYRVPQSYLEKSLRIGKIKVNNEKIKSSYKLKRNDQIILNNFNPSPNQNQIKKFRYDATKKDVSSASEIIIENNENFVVINKPPGISVQSGTKSKKNIVDILRKTDEFRDSTPYIVHRIDKDTTGVLIVAKNRKYAQLFTAMFRMRKIHKTYLAIVLGELNKKKGTFTDFLYHYEGKKKIITKAITHFSVIDSSIKYSLLKLSPETGRKHQLRKQLLLHGNPIIGDSKYRISSNKFNKKNELMLHAYKINFSILDVKYNFSVELPFAFKDVLKQKYLKIY